MNHSDDPKGAATAPATEDPERSFEVTLSLEQGYRFAIDAGLPGVAPFYADETPPLGEGSAPNPARLLVSSLASCLASSLAFCLRKARIELKSLRVTARGTLVRNERKRLRVGSIHVELFPEVGSGDESRMQRCLEIFEDFCIVTESVRHGVPVVVGVETHST